MSRRAIGICILTLVPLLLAQEPQPDTQVGDFLFKMPAGWTRVEKPNATLLVPSDAPPGSTVFLALLPAQELRGDLRSWYDKQWQDWARDYQILEGGDAKSQHAKNGYDTILTVATVRDKNQKTYRLFYMVAQAGTKVESYFLMADSNVPYERYRPARQTFLTSLRFANLQDATRAVAPVEGTVGTAQGGRESPPSSGSSVAPGAGDPRMVGIYRSILLDFHYEMGRTMSDWVYFYLLPDGRLNGGLPVGGLDNFDYVYQRKKSPGGWGVYRRSGNKGTVVYEPDQYNPQGTTVELTRDSEGVNLGGRQYRYIDPCDGLKLEGTFRQDGWQQEYTDKQGITFTPDGRFRDGGINRIITEFDINATTPPARPGSGTYHIANNTLSLDYANGRGERILFFVMPEDMKPSVTEIHLGVLVQPSREKPFEGRSDWKFIRVQ